MDVEKSLKELLAEQKQKPFTKKELKDALMDAYQHCRPSCVNGKDAWTMLRVLELTESEQMSEEKMALIRTAMDRIMHAHLSLISARSCIEDAAKMK